MGRDAEREAEAGSARDAPSEPMPDGRTSMPAEHNVEMDWAAVDPDVYLTPNDRFFVRSHGATPSIDAASWRLAIDGPGVDRPVSFDHGTLRRIADTTVVRALECAGNGRALFAATHGRTPPGALWRLGAVGVAEWTGVRLHDLLTRAGVRRDAVEVVPEGLDELRVRRPLPISKALADDTVVAVAMNGEPLPPDHGFPARLVVPGWAAVASIKWLGRIEVVTEPVFTWWNTEHYTLRGPGYERPGPAAGVVIADQVPKSALELPWPARIPAGPFVVTGRSWSPHGPIARVDVSVDGGVTWGRASLRGPNLVGAWVRWSFAFDAAPATRTIRVRATDRSGHAQPDDVPWNDRGYLYGGVADHPVEVVARSSR